MRVNRRKPLTANIGVFGVGHATYWHQFDGLLDIMGAKQKTFIEKLKTLEVEVFDFGLIDSSEKAYEAIPLIQGKSIDLLFVDMLTYSTSETFAPIIRLWIFLLSWLLCRQYRRWIIPKVQLSSNSAMMIYAVFLNFVRLLFEWEKKLLQ